MSSQSRTLAVLVMLAAGGVGMLGWMAQRYAKVVGPAQATGAGQQDRRVEAFIEVRRAMRRAIDGASDRTPRPEDLKRARDQALADVKLDKTAYGELRRAYRAWKAGTLPRSELIVRAFERRRARLAKVDLADYEPLDS